MNVAIYGSNGYLGNALKSVDSKFKCLRRFDGPLAGFVHIDFSFPNGDADEIEFLAYLELIRKRASVCREFSSKYVYIGSMSSVPPINSIYGKRKKTTEDLVLSLGGNILRLGLVVNQIKPGGRYLELREMVKRFPVIPITHEKYFQLFITEENAALTSMIAMLKSTVLGQTLIADGTLEKNLGYVLKEIAQSQRKRTLGLGVGLTRAFEFIVKKCNLRFLDSLRSLTATRTIGAQEHLPMETDAE
jgi:dTDP-4-dehydrorhamnose reductase